MRWIRCLAAACLVALVVIRPAGADLFQIDALAPGEPPVSVSGQSVVDLLDSAISRSDEFLVFEDLDSEFRLTYAGLRNAVIVNVNADGTEAELRLITGFSRTFTGADDDELADAIEDFIKQDGSQRWAEFLRAINRRTVVGVLDGNPFATTALMSGQTYRRFGLLSPSTSFTGNRFVLNGARSRSSSATPLPVAESNASDAPDAPAPFHESDPLTVNGRDPGDGGEARSEPAAWRDSPDDHHPIASSVFGLNVGYEAGSTDVGDPTLTSVEIFGGFNFAERVGLITSLSLHYVDIEGSQVFHGGVELALPVLLVGRDHSPVLWQITPSAGISAGASVDLAAGGLLWHAGVVNTLAFRLGPVTLSVANQYTYFKSIEVTVDEYDFDADLRQQVLRNGVRLAVGSEALGLSGPVRASVFGGVTHNMFLDDAAVDDWLTPEAGVGVRFGRGVNLAVTYRANLSSKFDSHGLSGELIVSY